MGKIRLVYLLYYISEISKSVNAHFMHIGLKHVLYVAISNHLLH